MLVLRQARKTTSPTKTHFTHYFLRRIDSLPRGSFWAHTLDTTNRLDFATVCSYDLALGASSTTTTTMSFHSSPPTTFGGCFYCMFQHAWALWIYGHYFLNTRGLQLVNSSALGIAQEDSRRRFGAILLFCSVSMGVYPFTTLFFGYCFCCYIGECESLPLVPKTGNA